jgi:ElaB/YqjD/DUF883 family membrane-anchored ribosome-binding protein
MANEIHIQPKDSDAAREEIERTRTRMSETIDEIEDVLLRKKAEIRTRLDVVARLREKPLLVVGVALGAGVLLGLITGGRDRSDDHANSGRADIWEARARRLLAIARSQEEEIDVLHSTVADLSEDADYEGILNDEEEDDYDDDLPDDGGPSRFSELKDAVANKAEELMSTAARTFLESVQRDR